MKAYSTDLRERVVLAAKQGMPQAEIARVFAISLSSIKRYLKQWRETNTLEPKAIPGRPSRKLALLQQDVELMLSAAPDATLEQHCQTWEQKQGIKVSISTMSRAIGQLGLTRKKRHWVPPSATKLLAVPGESR